MIPASLDLSICIVLYKSVDLSRSFAKQLVESLNGFSDWEILFYDNSPTNELADLGAIGTYAHDPSNQGFSFANNKMILASGYRNIALVNPDVFGFTSGFWEDLNERALGKAEVRFIKLLNEDGSHQDCVGEVTSLKRAWVPRPDYAALTVEQPVGMGIMAFMLTTRDVIARVGLLDCDYSLYAEDMDWCYRAHLQSVPVIYDPSFALTHLGGQSTGDRWTRSQSVTRKYDAERIFVNKHRRGLSWLLLRMLNLIKVQIRS